LACNLKTNGGTGNGRNKARNYYDGLSGHMTCMWINARAAHLISLRCIMEFENEKPMNIPNPFRA
jgi:hypothetical protein